MELEPRQRRLLDRLGVSQRWTGAVGLLVAALGIAYAIWGVLRFDPGVDPRIAPGFDAPVARIAFLYQSYQEPISRIRAETATEQVLLETLRDGMHFGAGVALVMLRLFLGTLIAVTGFVMMTVVVERRRLLQIIEQLRPDG